MMGKLRLALSPSQPEWFHASLELGARGLTTGAVPCDDRSIEIALDIPDRALDLHASDGASRRIPLHPGRPIAEIWADYTTALADLGVDAEIPDRPQEVADTTPLSEDHRDRTWDAASVGSWFTAITAIRNVFDEWRSSFFGRTGVEFWWGSFDLTVLAFTGRHATPPPDANFIMKYDLDAEFLALGFWPGDGQNDALFYGYIVPEPPGCAVHPLNAPGAGWVATMGEWVLPYEVVRSASDPRAALLEFMHSVYGAAGALGGWDLASFRYERPPNHELGH